MSFTPEIDARMDAVIAELEPEEELSRNEAARRIGVSAFILKTVELGAIEKFKQLEQMWTEYRTLS